MNHPKYRPDIDGLRALAVIAVVAFHANWMKGGYIGVDIFFVISGYLISLIIFQNLESKEFGIGDFYSRRVRRIFPALILVLCATLLVGWLSMLSDEFKQLGKHVFFGSLFTSNLVLWSEAGYFDGEAMTKPLLHLWSLGVEEQFYIVWPILLWVTFKRGLNFLSLVVVCALFSFWLNVSHTRIDPVAGFYSPQTRFWELMAGSIIAWLNLNSKIFIKIQKNAIISNFSSVIAFALIIFGFRFLDKNSEFPGYWVLIPVVSAVLFISAGRYSWINEKILGSKVAVWFGLISFPLYLWHWPILVYAQIFNNGETPARGVGYLLVSISIMLAWLTFKFIEKPIRVGSVGVARINVVLCGLMVALGFTGLVCWKQDLTNSRNIQSLWIKRIGSEHAVGSSFNWYEGKEGWLFLGNNWEKTVAKLKLAYVPTPLEIKKLSILFESIANAANKFNVHTFLIVGSNKSSIYSEYLPEEFKPSHIRYVDYYLDELKKIDGLTVYDPTADLLDLKSTQGFLYWKTDTHWNHKGAYFAYQGFVRRANEPVISVNFKKGTAHTGDLLKMSGIKNYPLTDEDDWLPVWGVNLSWHEEKYVAKNDPAFGAISVVKNNRAPSNKVVWVVGDSFTEGLKPYLNATFKEVHYMGHWAKKLQELPQELYAADQKPDLILIVKVERSF